jgi:predicted ATPase
MRKALAAHDEVLRSAIEGRGGWLFKHTGDGVCAAFASPKAAVDAAVAAQHRLELPVRMGLATGEADLRGADYFGAVLNRAARVMAAGHGGQILVADSTAGLLSGVDLLDLGPRRLRDLSTPVGVFQVRAAGLRKEFPPLKAIDVSRGNLPPAITALIGRQSEVAEVEAALRTHRMVTLTGVGGVGKTRLALEVAARLADEFPDGVWLFELAAVTDPAAVPDAVAAVLGITQQPNKTVGESVAAASEGRIRLLLFDNCEHILDAAADLVDAILAKAATVRVLATSREGLGVGDEQLWPVPSLDVGAGLESAAVALFVERARSVTPRFSLTHADEATAVIEICRRLDGIPLAIELAASRISSMAATDIRDRLDHRFRLLVGSRRGLKRHQTLRHAVAWSYDLLDDAEKSLLAGCSVFCGGFDLQSACTVTGFDDVDEYVVLDLLDALVRKSLLVIDRSAGRARYSMLETIREFAEEQLVAAGTAEQVRAAHARYFAGRESDVLALWDSPRQRDAYTWFIAELPNLRTAFRWAADRGDLDDAATIATYAGFFGYLVDNFEPIAWAEELVEPARAVGHPRLAFLYVVASMCWTVGRIDAAVGYSDGGQAIVGKESAEVPFGIHGWLGSSYGFTSEPERSVEWYRAELERGRDTHTSTWSCLVSTLGFIVGRDEEAMTAAIGLIDAAEATQNPFAISYALHSDGIASRDTIPDRARKVLRPGLVIAQDSGNRAIETHMASTLAFLEAISGDPQAALEYFAISIRRYQDAGNTANVRAVLTALAACLHRLGRYEPAASILGFAFDPLSARGVAGIDITIAHLRDVLGDQNYESLARPADTTTTAAMVMYAYDQIDQARAELNAASKYTS